MSVFNLCPKTQALLLRGNNYNTARDISFPDFYLEILELCKKLRFCRYFENTNAKDNFMKSQHIQQFARDIEPPHSLDSVFENNISNLEHIFDEHNLYICSDDKETKILSKLAKNKDLKICKADKGGCLVILNKSDYKKMIFSHLNDISTYTKIDCNQDKNTSSKIKSLLTTHEGCLLTDEIKYLTEFQPKTSYFYVLPKLHKNTDIQKLCKSINEEYVYLGYCPNDLPSRPIISNVDSPTSRLSHFVDSLLKPLISIPSCYIRDSFHFLQILPRQFSKKQFFVNLDVVSLYTNIPKTFGLESIHYWLNKFSHLLDSRFSVQFILNSLELILSNNTFCFEQQHFIQIKGTAMGTKVAPTYAHLVMAYLENQILESCKLKFGCEKTESFFRNYWRFLDDILIITDLCLSDIHLFLHHIIHFHPSFSFTFDINSLKTTFLDISLYFKNYFIETDIFYKSTDSRRYLHFYSKHPRHIKRNIPYCLSKRICTIVSNSEVRMYRLRELKARLQQLKYPNELINDAIKKALSPNKEKISNNTVENKINFVFTYSKNAINVHNKRIKPIIENLNNEIFREKPIRIQRCLRQSGSILKYLNSQHHFNVKKCSRPRCKLCPLIIESKNYKIINNVKIKFNTNMTCTSRNVIYILFCSCDEFYVGQTKQQLCNRATVHRQQIKNEKYSFLKVSKHIQNCGGNFKILPIFCVFKSSFYFLSKLEFYFIRILKPTLNCN